MITPEQACMDLAGALLGMAKAVGASGELTYSARINVVGDTLHIVRQSLEHVEEPTAGGPCTMTDWIEWDGKIGDLGEESPIRVSLRFRDGTEHDGCDPTLYSWKLRGAHDDIVAYKVAENEEAVRVCAQAYQVVGSMLGDLGQFQTDRAEKILDNLSLARMVHDDVLPWPSFEKRAPAATNKLTKADTVALWHAIEDMRWMLHGMKQEPPCTPEQILAQAQRMQAASRALRKVNAIRKAQP